MPPIPLTYVELHRPAVERVIRAMRLRPAVPLTLSEMASLSFMSPFHFNRVFHLMTGIPPGLFQSAFRYIAAKKLLLTTARPVEEICEELGFLSPGTFSRQFKAKVGVAPERLRRLARIIQESAFQIDGPLPAFLEALEPTSGLAGEVYAPEGFDGLVAVALFKKATPAGWPAACTMRFGAGIFALPQTPDGVYYLLAAGLDRRADIAASLMDGDPILRSNSRGLQVLIRQGRISGLPEQGLRLRPADPLDPPILFAFPALILEPLLGFHDTARDEGRPGGMPALHDALGGARVAASAGPGGGVGGAVHLHGLRSAPKRCHGQAKPVHFGARIITL